jgi:SAM-dependent methyltransferase
MAEIVTGIRSILKNPGVYVWCQDLLGAGESKKRFVVDRIQPYPGMRLLDIGCGPATLLSYLPASVEYLGFDPNPAYTQRARRQYGDRGTFLCADVDAMTGRELSSFDVAVALGVLHHLDDSQARSLFSLAGRALRPGGRFLAVDPCLVAEQSPVARLLVALDRGRNVRTPEGYASLAATSFARVASAVEFDRLRIPYSHHLLECTMV